MKRFLVLAVLITSVVPAWAQKVEVIEQVLVKVNGDIITKTELEDRQVATLRQKRQDLSEEAALKAALAEITPSVLAESVDELLILQRARELGYRMTDENFQNILENIKKENKMETEEQFQAALKQEGLTIDQLRAMLEKRMMVSRVEQAEVMGKISITAVEERAYYEAHVNEFTTPATVTFREILVTVPLASNQPAGSVNVGLEEETEAKVEALRKRLVAGEDFARLTVEVSEAASKANGGLIGPISENELAEPIREALKPLKAGELSQVVRTARGFQVFRLDALTEAQALPFEQARNQIADRVYAERRAGEFEKYMKRLRAQAIIEWKNEELHQAYDQFTAKRQAGSQPES